MSLINNGIEPTERQVSRNNDDLIKTIQRDIRRNFDQSITTQQAASYISLAELWGYTDLAAEMRGDLETEIKK